MSIFYQAVEILATFLDNYISFSIVEVYTKQNHFRIKIIQSILITILISYLNSFLLFSNGTVFLTLCIWGIFFSLFFKIKPTVSFTIALFYLIIIDIADFSVLEFLQLFGGYGALQMMSKVGFSRSTLILSMKSILILSYLLLKKAFRKKFPVDQVHFKWLLPSAIVVFLCVCYTTDSVFSNNLWRIKLSILMDWAFMFLFVLVLLRISSWMTKVQLERNNNRIIAIRNQMLENNYKSMHTLYQANARNYHDFNNHLLALRELIRNNHTAEAADYIHQIAQPFQDIAQRTWTGVDVVDAILNDKFERCKRNHITLSVSADFPPNFHMEFQDICAILSNLLDNSIEACMAILDETMRKIRLCIHPINKTLIIKVENTVKENPLLNNRNLKTTKSDSKMHGWGMQSVRAAVQQYDGFLQHVYKENLFVTIISIPY